MCVEAALVWCPRLVLIQKPANRLRPQEAIAAIQANQRVSGRRRAGGGNTLSVPGIQAHLEESNALKWNHE